MRSSLLLFFVLVSLASACGSKPNKSSEDYFVIESEQHKKVSLLFFNENDEVISKTEHSFPVGAFEAKVFVDASAKIVDASFTTCCGKTIGINFKEKDANGTPMLKEFRLSNEKHKLNLYFDDGDVAILSRESL